MIFKTGIGTDLHKLDLHSTKPLRIGGINIPAPFGIIAHSDGDVLIHAICDALLGALGQGDIGELFPDNDPAYKDKDSSYFISEVIKMLEGQNFNIQNIDCILHLQQPKLKDFKPQIRANVASLLKIPESSVNIKAKTREKLDAVGNSEAIEAIVSVLIYKED